MKRKDKLTTSNSNVSITTLNVSGLNVVIKSRNWQVDSV